MEQYIQEEGIEPEMGGAFAQGTTLPSSFLGSRAWASNEVADSLAIC